MLPLCFARRAISLDDPNGWEKVEKKGRKERKNKEKCVNHLIKVKCENKTIKI